MSVTPAQLAELEAIVRATPWLMSALATARAVDAPDWAIGAGAVRGSVWDVLSGVPAAVPADVDLAFFDPLDLRRERDTEVTAALHARQPELPWEATNQAAVHTWYHEVFGRRVAPLRSTAEGVGSWPETATSVAVRLRGDGSLAVIAPHGLGDLLEMTHRRNSARATVAEFERRLQSKRIAERWPRARIISG